MYSKFASLLVAHFLSNGGCQTNLQYVDYEMLGSGDVTWNVSSCNNVLSLFVWGRRFTLNCWTWTSFFWTFWAGDGQVLNDKGYDGAVADVWSCGVILFVLMAGFLPFDEADLNTLYSKVWYIFNMGGLLHKEFLLLPSKTLQGIAPFTFMINGQILEATLIAILMTFWFLKPTMGLKKLMCFLKHYFSMRGCIYSDKSELDALVKAHGSITCISRCVFLSF
jgi:hypothetical protein